MFLNLESTLLGLASTMPLELFAFIASVFEEIVAPIPSPTIMMLTGSFASVQERTLFALLPLAVLGALGKTIGAVVVYTVADKAEDFVMERFGRFFGVSEEDVASFREKIGTGIRGYVMLTLLRSFPFVPSTVVSVGSGLIKVPLPTFTVSTFLGTIVRDGFYLYAGYVGTHVLARIVSHSGNIENYLEIGVVTLALAYLGYKIYKKNTRGKSTTAQ